MCAAEAEENIVAATAIMDHTYVSQDPSEIEVVSNSVVREIG